MLKSENARHRDVIGLVFDDSLDRDVVERAIAIWEGCESYQVGFPAVVLGARDAARVVTVRYRPLRYAPVGRRRCGSFKGDTIVLYGYVVERRGKRIHCGSLEQNLAHELGHVLGLADAPNLPSCETHIMAPRLRLANFTARAVRPEECRALDRRWVTSRELGRPNPRVEPALGPWLASGWPLRP